MADPGEWCYGCFSNNTSKQFGPRSGPVFFLKVKMTKMRKITQHAELIYMHVDINTVLATKYRANPVCSATETSYTIEISPEVGLSVTFPTE